MKLLFAIQREKHASHTVDFFRTGCYRAVVNGGEKIHALTVTNLLPALFVSRRYVACAVLGVLSTTLSLPCSAPRLSGSRSTSIYLRFFALLHAFPRTGRQST